MREDMGTIERIKAALAEDPYAVGDLDSRDGVEKVTDEHYETWRWGDVWLAVYRDLETKELAGVLYRTQPEDRVRAEFTEVVPVTAEVVTKTEYIVGKAA